MVGHMPHGSHPNGIKGATFLPLHSSFLNHSLISTSSTSPYLFPIEQLILLINKNQAGLKSQHSAKMDFKWKFEMPPEDFEAVELTPSQKLLVMAAFNPHEDLTIDGRDDRKPLAYNHICAITLYELRNELEYLMEEKQWPEHPTINAAAARNFYLDNLNTIWDWIERHKNDKEKINIAMDKIRAEYYDDVPERWVVVYFGLPNHDHF